MKYEVEMRRTTWQSGRVIIEADNQQQAHAIGRDLQASEAVRWGAPAGASEVITVTACEDTEAANDGGVNELSASRLPREIRRALREVIDHFYDSEALDYETTEHRDTHVFEPLLMLARWLHKPGPIG